MPLKDDSKTSTRTIRENASIVGTLFDLFYLQTTLIHGFIYTSTLPHILILDIDLVLIHSCCLYDDIDANSDDNLLSGHTHALKNAAEKQAPPPLINFNAENLANFPRMLTGTCSITGEIVFSDCPSEKISLNCGHRVGESIDHPQSILKVEKFVFEHCISVRIPTDRPRD